MVKQYETSTHLKRPGKPFLQRLAAWAGRGMLSVIVVHKVGDMQPGPGFFQLAKKLGRDTSDKTI